MERTTMTSYLDDFLTTGGIDDEDITLRNARFTRDVQYRDGQEPFLLVDIVPANPDVTELTEQRIGIGAGWEEAEDEGSVSRVDGKKPAFHTQSKAGRLLESIGKAPGFKEAVEARIAAGDTPPAPTDAAFWEGIQGHIRQQEQTFTTREGTEANFRFFVFEEITGWEGVKAAAKPAKKAAAKKADEPAAGTSKPAKKAAAKKPAAKPEPAEVEVDEPAPPPAPPPASDASDGVRAQLVAHCQNTSAESHVDWMIEAYEAFADELTADESLQTLVDNESEIWTEVWG
jgi:hypothetical protein